ncbi:uncharacterized protein C20orf85-like [Actinia tenebrosa]|uniref:Uncharacterized protein C20orf85-like n=1 Tax=Actinia tenebrosa TaxID=6105 RepID=A0A6P8IYA9_ACTTE|nr:uncharacterized protein C20orf85-like [Actinia tenebrosa]
MVLGKGSSSCNFVAQDQIWKDHVVHEHGASKYWPENWGFLIEQYQKLAKEDTTEATGAAAVRVKQRRENLKLPPIDSSVASQLSVGKSTALYPNTTSQEIGWRSSQRQCNLEKYGRYSKPRSSFLGQMKWPPESIG